MTEDIITTEELHTFSEPPTIIAEDEDGNNYVEISSEEIKKLNLLYRKVVKFQSNN